MPLGVNLAAALKGCRAQRLEERLAAGAAYEDGDLVVVDELGRPPYPQSYSGWFQRHCEMAELPRIRLHDLRHTAASLLAAEGVSIAEAAHLMGHDPNVYAKTYLHLYPENSKAAIDKLDRVLGSYKSRQ